MSYWIYLEDKSGETVPVPRHNEGATQCFSLDGEDGYSEAEINVTYNYARHFSFRDLHEKIASETVPMLREAVERLGTDRDLDYWAPTPGNAGYACRILLGWAERHPNAVWAVH